MPPIRRSPRTPYLASQARQRLGRFVPRTPPLTHLPAGVSQADYDADALAWTSISPAAGTSDDNPGGWGTNAGWGEHYDGDSSSDWGLGPVSQGVSTWGSTEGWNGMGNWGIQSDDSVTSSSDPATPSSPQSATATSS
ncbi:hypothetical protein B0H13DRAFT_2350220 [Mycena leptocephala]|nr:hypothetical protein B0H13DRAFT_2350220 [Mycena leptocephala]